MHFCYPFVTLGFALSNSGRGNRLRNMWFRRESDTLVTLRHGKSLCYNTIPANNASEAIIG